MSLKRYWKVRVELLFLKAKEEIQEFDEEMEAAIATRALDRIGLEISHVYGCWEYTWLKVPDHVEATTLIADVDH